MYVLDIIDYERDCSNVFWQTRAASEGKFAPVMHMKCTLSTVHNVLYTIKVKGSQNGSQIDEGIKVHVSSQKHRIYHKDALSGDINYL